MRPGDTPRSALGNLREKMSHARLIRPPFIPQDSSEMSCFRRLANLLVVIGMFLFASWITVHWVFADFDTLEVLRLIV